MSSSDGHFPGQFARHAIVTGGAGFIGRHLIKSLLRQGLDVTCVDDFSTSRSRTFEPLEGESRLKLVEGRVEDLKLLVDRPVDVVYHLASRASPRWYYDNPLATISANVEGTVACIDVCTRWGARLVYASTSEVYGEPLRHPQTEQDPGVLDTMSARAPYAESKRLAETLIATYARQGLLSATILRLFNVYGPGMDPNDGRIIPEIITRILEARDIDLHGDGQQTRTFCFVDDVVDAMQAASSCKAIGPINVGGEREMTMLELCHMLFRLMGTDRPIRFIPSRQDDPSRRQPDTSMARALLGWRPTTPIEDGLTTTIEDLSSSVSQTLAVRG